MDLLGDKDAGAGGIDALGIAAINVVAGRGSEEVAVTRRAHHQGIGSRSGTSQATILGGRHVLGELSCQGRREIVAQVAIGPHRGSSEDISARVLTNLERR